MKNLYPDISPNGAMRAANKEGWFPTTHWSVVGVAQGTDEAASERTLAHLFSIYWKPINHCIRRLGQTAQEAEDLTQEFFSQMVIRRNLFLVARQERGPLRNYVCVAVKRMVYDSIRSKTRQKRGGGQHLVSMDTFESPLQAPDEIAPDKDFDQQWAKALKEQSLSELESDYRERGLGILFDDMRGHLMSENDETTKKRHGMAVGTQRMALSRPRKRQGTTFRKQVAASMPGSTTADIDAEIVYLMEIFG